MSPGRPVPGGDPPVYRGPYDPEGGAPSSGGLPEAARTQGGEPAPQFDEPQMPVGTTLNPDEEAEERMRQQNGEPTYVDARSLRISGKDANGKMFGASLWLPQSQPDRTLSQMGDAALRDLVSGESRVGHVAGLAAFQKALNQHYGARR
jgi:hypothetical protein